MKNPNAYWEDINNKANMFDGDGCDVDVYSELCKQADENEYGPYTEYKDKEEDKVNHPSHYCQGGIEVIDIIESAVTGLEPFEAVCAGNAIKYLCRWKHKNGVEDLQKAIWYINKLIEHNSGE